MFRLHAEMEESIMAKDLYNLKKIAIRTDVQFIGIDINEGIDDGELNITLIWESQPSNIESMVEKLNKIKSKIN